MRTEDGCIIQQCLDGNAAAFGFLVNKYKDPVYALAYSQVHNFHDAQDITQEVFIKAYQKLRDLRRWDSFMGWLCRITNNICRNWLRSRARRPDLEFIEDQDPGILDRSSMDSYHENMIYESIHYALDSLPELYSQVLVLRYFGGMTTREMSRFLAVSTSTIERRLRQARAQLKEGMLATMSKSYEQHQLPATFTFRIVEAVKHIKINPMPRMAGLPWGLSLAAGIIITVLSLNPQMSINSNIIMLSDSPFPAEARALETEEISVDMMEILQVPPISGNQGDSLGVFCLAEAEAASNEGRIVFQRGNRIWVMDADGKNQKQLTEQDSYTPTWSPDGRRIAFSIGDIGDICIINADGAIMKQLTEGPEHDICPTWSPDGKRIAFARKIVDLDLRKSLKSGIYAMDADGSNVKKLVEKGPSLGIWSPDWSPDGSKIVFELSFGNKAPQIWVMNADGSDQQMLNEWGEDPAWSPDGAKIAFVSNRDTWNTWKTPDICVMDADGANVEILTDPGRPFNDMYPVWSPDGTKIAFVSDQDGSDCIYVMDANGSNIQLLIRMPRWPYYPDWTTFSYAVDPAGKLPTTWGETKSN